MVTKARGLNWRFIPVDGQTKHANLLTFRHISRYVVECRRKAFQLLGQSSLRGFHNFTARNPADGSEISRTKQNKSRYASEVKFRHIHTAQRRKTNVFLLGCRVENERELSLTIYCRRR